MFLAFQKTLLHCLSVGAILIDKLLLWSTHGAPHQDYYNP